MLLTVKLKNDDKAIRTEPRCRLSAEHQHTRDPLQQG